MSRLIACDQNRPGHHYEPLCADTGLPMAALALVRLAALALAVFALTVPTATAAPTAGSIAARLGPHSAAGAVTVLPNAKIVVAGFSGRGGLTVARYRDDGRLDRSFGREGVTTTGYRYRPAAILQRPGGGFVVLGAYRDPCGGEYACQERLPLFGFTAAGLPDPGFGSGGVSWALAGTRGGGLASQPDGRILVAATDSVCHTECISGSAELARFLPDGSLDPGFGTGGVVRLPGPGGAFAAVATEPDGSIVAAGNLGGGAGPRGPILARFSRDGVLDPGFGEGGLAAAPPGFGVGSFQSLALSEAWITAAGGGSSRVRLARYSLSGELDPGFGSAGIAAAALGSPDSHFFGEARLLPTSNQRVYATIGPVGLACRKPNRFEARCRTGLSVARFGATGRLDPSFGHGGVSNVLVGAGRGEEDAFGSPTAIAAGPHGEVVVAGNAPFVAADDPRHDRDSFAIAAFERDRGGLDPSFGHGGVVLTPASASSRPRGSRRTASRLAFPSATGDTIAICHLRPFVLRFSLNGLSERFRAAPTRLSG